MMRKKIKNGIVLILTLAMVSNAAIAYAAEPTETDIKTNAEETIVENVEANETEEVVTPTEEASEPTVEDDTSEICDTDSSVIEENSSNDVTEEVLTESNENSEEVSDTTTDETVIENDENNSECDTEESVNEESVENETTNEDMTEGTENSVSNESVADDVNVENTAETNTIICFAMPRMVAQTDNEWQTEYFNQLHYVETEDINNYAFDNKILVQELVDEYMEYKEYIESENDYNDYINEFYGKMDNIPTARMEVVSAVKDYGVMTQDQSTLYHYKFNQIVSKLLAATNAQEKNSVLDAAEEELDEYMSSGQEELDRLKTLNTRITETLNYAESISSTGNLNGLSQSQIEQISDLKLQFIMDVQAALTIEDANEIYNQFKRDVITVTGDESYVTNVDSSEIPDDSVDEEAEEWRKTYKEELNASKDEVQSLYSVGVRETVTSYINGYLEKVNEVTDEESCYALIAEYNSKIEGLKTAFEELIEVVDSYTGDDDDIMSARMEKLSEMEEELLACKTVAEKETYLSNANSVMKAYLDSLTGNEGGDSGDGGNKDDSGSGNESDNKDDSGSGSGSGSGSDDSGSKDDSESGNDDKDESGNTGSDTEDGTTTGGNSTSSENSGSNSTSSTKDYTYTTNIADEVILKSVDGLGDDVTDHMIVFKISDERKAQLEEKIDKTKAPGSTVWFYEVKVSDATYPLTITAKLPGYEGKSVKVVHFVNGITPEYLDATVSKDGVTFTVSDLSPIAIVSNGTVVNTTTGTGSIGTSDTANIGAFTAIGLASVFAICVVLKKKKIV